MVLSGSYVLPAVPAPTIQNRDIDTPRISRARYATHVPHPMHFVKCIAFFEARQFVDPETHRTGLPTAGVSPWLKPSGPVISIRCLSGCLDE